MTTTDPPARLAGRTMTIAGIAREAGVSVPTVSKVINGRADVAADTRRRVEAVMRSHDYRRTRRGTRHAPLIEVVFNELESEWAMEIVRGVERVALDSGLALVVSDLRGHEIPPADWIAGVLARRPMGVITVLADLGDDLRDRLRTRSIPLVVVDPTGEPAHDVPSVGATNWSGGLEATRHLLGLGHRRIAVIAGPADILCSRARLDGFRAAMDAAGVPVDPDLVRHGDFHVESGIREARALLRLPDPPTAVFAANDLQALGVYQAARELRLHIPDDVSVVGFDDLPVATWVGPPLTTVRQPLIEMAAAAARLIVRLSRGEPPGQTRIELATALVVRDSTAPPRGPGARTPGGRTA